MKVYRLSDHARAEMAGAGTARRRWDDWIMKVTYDRTTDTLTVIFADTAVAESDEDKPGVILDYDNDGNLVGLEILDASQRVAAPTQIDYQIVPAGAGK